jgi:hypothetical protein
MESRAAVTFQSPTVLSLIVLVPKYFFPPKKERERNLTLVQEKSFPQLVLDHNAQDAIEDNW